jgi:hypothetical protein
MRGARDAECDERPQRHSASSVSGLHIQMCSCTCRVIMCPPVCRVLVRLCAIRPPAAWCPPQRAAGHGTKVTVPQNRTLSQ